MYCTYYAKREMKDERCYLLLVVWMFRGGKKCGPELCVLLFGFIIIPYWYLLLWCLEKLCPWSKFTSAMLYSLPSVLSNLFLLFTFYLCFDYFTWKKIHLSEWYETLYSYMYLVLKFYKFFEDLWVKMGLKLF